MKKISVFALIILLTTLLVIGMTSCKSHTHSFDKTVVAPTCNDDGFTIYNCSCGERYTDDFVEKTGHKPGNWEIMVQPTCESKGSRAQKCSVCEMLLAVLEIDSTDHRWSEGVVVDGQGNCESGYDITYTCLNCGETKTEKTKTHSYVKVDEKAPTCTEDGYVYWSCTQCSHFKAETKHALGHLISSYTERTEPTCEKNGKIAGKCDSCGEIINKEIPATGHLYGDVTTSGGYCGNHPVGTVSCLNCDKIIAKFGHTFEETVVKATCTTSGKITHKCIDCGYSYEERLTAPGHIASDWQVITEPTCASVGLKEQYCIICGTVLSDADISKLPHKYTSRVEGGEIIYTCSCGDSYWVQVENYVNLTLMSGEEIISHIQVPMGEEIEISLPSREGYIFAGWYFDSELGNPCVVYLFDRDTVLFAGWQQGSASGELDTNNIFTNAPVDFTFDVVSDVKLTDSNVKDYVNVYNAVGELSDIYVKEENGDVYTVASESYEEGMTYHATLDEGVSFSETEKDKIIFITDGSKKVNIEYKPDVKLLDKSSVAFFGSDGNLIYLALYEDLLDANNNAAVYEGEIYNISFAVKVESETKANGLYVYTVTEPDLDDIFAKYEVYDEVKADFSDVVIDESYKQSIAEAIEQTEAYSEIVKAAKSVKPLVDGKKYKFDIPIVLVDVRPTPTALIINYYIKAKYVNENDKNDSFNLVVQKSTKIGTDAVFQFSSVLDWSVGLKNYISEEYSLYTDKTYDNGDIIEQFSKKLSESYKKGYFEEIDLTSYEFRKRQDLKEIEIASYYGVKFSFVPNIVIDLELVGDCVIDSDIELYHTTVLSMNGLFDVGVDNDIGIDVNTKMCLYGKEQVSLLGGAGFEVSFVDIVDLLVSLSYGTYYESGGIANINVSDSSDVLFVLSGTNNIGFKVIAEGEVGVGFNKLKKKFPVKIFEIEIPLLSLGTNEVPIKFTDNDNYRAYTCQKTLDISKIINTEAKVYVVSKNEYSKKELTNCKYYLNGSYNNISLSSNGILTANIPEGESIEINVKVVCGAIYKVVALNIVGGHSVKLSPYTPPTCVKEGHTEYQYCTLCGTIVTEYEILPVKGHDYAFEYKVDADCINKGYTVYACACGDYYEADFIEPNGIHNYGEWIDVEAGGCSVEPFRMRICIGCGELETTGDPYHAHDYEIETKDATCTENGYVKAVCKNCGNVGTEQSIPALGHSYLGWKTTKNPTCSELGEKERLCYKCRHIDSGTIDKTDHVYGEWYVYKQMTPDSDGEKRRECKYCDEYEKVTIPTDGICREHNWINDPNPDALRTEATCVAKATYYKSCGYENCDAVNRNAYFESGELKKHTDDEMVVDKPATCTEEGLKKFSCDLCGFSKTQSIKTIPHTPGRAVLENEFTGSCFIKGKYDQVTYCTVCGNECSRETIRTDYVHVYGEWLVVTDKTLTKDGLERQECAICGHTNDRVIPADGNCPGHKFVENPISKYQKSPATCSSPAICYKSCEICQVQGGEIFEHGAPLEHFESDYNWTETQPATCYAKGVRVGVCKACGAVKMDSTPMVDHTEGNIVIENRVNGDCTTKESHDEVKYCVICKAEISREHKELEYNHNFTSDNTSSKYLKDGSTCTSKAVYYLSCTDCGLAHEFETFEHGDFAEHDYVENPKKEYLKSESTCAKAATYYKSCSVCGKQSTEYFSYGSPKTHPEGDWKVEDPTCSKEGIKYLDCSICGPKTETIKKLDHTPGKVEKTLIREGSCNARSLYECVTYCSVCNQICSITEDFGDFKHNYGAWKTVFEPTYDKEGLRQQVCSGCGDVKRETIPATGICTHVWASDAEAKYLKSEANCISPATYYKHCNICDAVSKEYFASGGVREHGDDDYKTVKNATCTEEGRKELNCPLCGKQDVISLKKLNHTDGEVKEEIIKGSCTVKEVKKETTYCSVCNGVIRTTTESYDYVHDFSAENTSSKYLKSESTCESKAEYYYSCALCGKIDNENSFSHGDPKGHSFARVKADKYLKSAATCTSPALYYYSCSVCQKIDYTQDFEYGEKLQHSYGIPYPTIPATCQSDGENRADCIYKCGSYKTYPVPAGKHSPATPVKENEVIGSCTVKGSYELVTYCSACSCEISRTPKEGDYHHDFTEKNTDPKYLKSSSNCSNAAEYYYSCSNCDAYDENNTFTYGGLGYHVWEQNPDSKYLKSKATCTEPEKYYLSCKVCGAGASDSFSYGAPLGHNYLEQWYPYTAVSCISEGEYRDDCTRCDGYQSKFTPMIDHKWAKKTVTPTCLEGGYTLTYCSYCGYEKSKTNITDPLGHKASAGFFSDNPAHHYNKCINSPDCEVRFNFTEHNYVTKTTQMYDPNSGKYTITVRVYCDVCDYELQQTTTELHEHNNPQIVNGIPATCTEDGLKYGLICGTAGCGKTLQPQETIPALGHNYLDGICLNCGYMPAKASEGLEYTLSTDGTYYIVSGIGTCTDTDIVIPATYNGLPVKEIGERAFDDCTSLKSIIIPDSVISIGACVFENCTSLTSAIIGKSVRSISSFAFTNCTSLTSITIPDSVTYIEQFAFENCHSLTSVTIGNSVIGIAHFAFAYCDSLTSITIPDSVTTIQHYAFGHCYSLASVTIGNSVTTIQKEVFAVCTSLTNITIPNSVTSIGEGVFVNCTSLISIEVEEKNQYYESIDGNLYFKGDKDFILIQYAKGKTDTSFEVPSGVTSIGSYAFYNCTSLTSVVIGDSVTSIGNNAFCNCSSLTRIVIPDSVTSIGEGAFSSCTSFTCIVIPDSVTSIGNYAFKYCTSLTSVVIGDSVTSIGNTAFYYCTSLTSIVIPDSVTSIGNYAFYNCTSLSDVYYRGDAEAWEAISIGSSNERLTSATRYYYSESAPTVKGNFWHYVDGVPTVWPEYVELPASEGLAYTLSSDGTYYIVSGIGTCTDTDVVIPATYNGLPVKEIGYDAFLSCTSLTSIVIPDRVTSIGDCAFLGCKSLTSVVIPDGVTSIGNYSFAHCYSLTSIVIPDSVTSIGDGAFYYCTSLTSIEVDADNQYYKSIGGNLYSKDGKTLIQYAIGKTDTSFKVPSGVTSIGDWAFEDCTSLTSIVIPDSVTSIGDCAFFNCTSLTSVVIPDSVTSIGESAFRDCDSLTSVVIGDGVTSIGVSTFYNCSSLTRIVIPDSVTSIGWDAFYGCTSLTSVVIGDSVTSIGYDAFYYCFSLSDVYYRGDAEAWEAISIGSLNEKLTSATRYYYSESAPTVKGNFWHYVDGIPTVWPEYVELPASEGLEYTLSSDGTYYIVSGIGTCTDTDIVIPSTYNGLPVKEIGDEAFEYCSSLTSIVIPDSVTSIGYEALLGCKSLTSVEIGDGVTSIGNRAFCGCSSLTSIVIPDSVTSIDDWAFYNCTSLTSIVIPNSVTSIGDWAFEYCESLTSIVIPDSVTIIGEGAFYKCTSLTSVVIPDSVTSIGYQAFYRCTSLTSIVIPDSVTSIGRYAFYYCSSLTSIVIGDSVTSIGDRAFYYCTSLTSIVIPDSATSIGDEAFYCCTSLTSIVIGNSVTSIGDYAFYGCSSLTSIVIPDSVTCIGDYAFLGCDSLTSIVIPDSVTIIGDWAFSYCESLTSVVIGNRVTSIGAWAFYKCTSLTSVEIGNSVTSIGYRAFSSCDSLTSVEIGDGVTSIGDYAFSYCDSLTSIEVDADNQYYKSIDGNLYSKDGKTLIQYTIGKTDTSFKVPSGVTSIGDYAFYNCKSLTSIVIPDSVTSIGYEVFFNCTSLTSVVIGNGVTSIGNSVFFNCRSLKDVYYTGTSTEWSKISIGSSNTYLTGARIHYNYVAK